MEAGPSRKQQGAAFGLVVIAVVVAASGYFYSVHQKKTQGDSNAPINQVGRMLGVEVMRGKAPVRRGGTGAQFAKVYPGGVAAGAGLQDGDIIMTANGTEVSCPNDLVGALKETFGREEIALEVERNGEVVQAKLPAKSGAPAGGGDSSSGETCPVSQVGEMLGVEVVKGHAPTASGGSGAGIQSVTPGGVAAKSGLLGGDVVTAANGRPTSCPRDLLEALSTSFPKKPVALDIERRGKPMKITIPAQQPEQPASDDESCPVSQVGSMLGVEVYKGHAPTASGGSGAGIQVVTPGGVGDKAGLKAGDVVTAANGRAVTCPRDLLEALSSDWPKGKVVLDVERKGQPLQVTIPAR